jgi:hypothetical protein
MAVLDQHGRRDGRVDPTGKSGEDAHLSDARRQGG